MDSEMSDLTAIERAMRLAVILFAAVFALAAHAASYGPELEGFDYPYPVRDFALESQGDKLIMRYMDVAPATPNGRTIFLLHGKNFCAATWGRQIADLTGATSI